MSRESSAPMFGRYYYLDVDLGCVRAGLYYASGVLLAFLLPQIKKECGRNTGLAIEVNVPFCSTIYCDTFFSDFCFYLPRIHGF